MRIVSLSSGSKGNCTYIETNKYQILIDVGLSMKQINERLLIAGGIDLEDIDFILITHSHSDHIKSLGSIGRKYKDIIFLMDSTLLKEEIIQDNIYDNVQVVNGELVGNDLIFNNFELDHDTYCIGWTIKEIDTNESLCFIADNGMYPYKVRDIEALHKPFTYYMIESNYDEFSQYIDTTRNELLKRRVLSPNGHSSNFNAIEKLVRIIEQGYGKKEPKDTYKGIKGVMFTHLSEHCNSEELARKSHRAYIEVWGKIKVFHNVTFKYARQDEIVFM